MKYDFSDTSPEVSKRMSKVKRRRGKYEVILAKALWHSGLRYKYNYKKLPGSPDIAITRYKIAIFIDGEFWHGYNWEQKKKNLGRHKEYWIRKIERNMDRDIKNDILLVDKGWIPIHFWENEVKKNIQQCVDKIFSILVSRL